MVECGKRVAFAPLMTLLVQDVCNRICEEFFFEPDGVAFLESREWEIAMVAGKRMRAARVAGQKPM